MSRRLAVLLACLWWAIAATATAASASPAVFDTAADPGSGLGEPEVAVNPLDPSDVVIGENNSGVRVSRDGGHTFRPVSLANPGDNVLTASPDGTFTYSALDGQVHVSHDGGESWTTVGNWVGEVAAQTELFASVPGGTVAGREVGCSAPGDGTGAGPVDVLPGGAGPGPQVIGCDRPWLTADAASGRLYVSFADHDDAAGGGLTLPWELADLGCRDTVLVNPAFQCGRQYVSSSADGGRTWGMFHPIDTPRYPADGTGGFNGGPVARAGVLATAYAAKGPGCRDCIVFETSRDGGAHWTQHVTPATIAPATVTTLDGSLLFQPYLAGDPAHRGRYAIAVFDSAQAHLLVYVTRDFGASWHGPARLAAPGAATTAYQPWIAYAPSGAFGSMWRALAADGTYTVWAAVSPRGGTAGFRAPVQLSSAPSPGPVNQLAGDDASSVTLSARSLYAAWGDRRGGSLGIHFARWDFSNNR